MTTAQAVEVVLQEVATVCGLTVRQVVGRSQAPKHLRARVLAAALCHGLTKATAAQIGQRFDGRGYDWVGDARRSHRGRLVESPQYRRLYRLVSAAIEEKST